MIPPRRIRGAYSRPAREAARAPSDQADEEHGDARRVRRRSRAGRRCGRGCRSPLAAVGGSVVGSRRHRLDPFGAMTRFGCWAMYVEECLTRISSDTNVLPVKWPTAITGMFGLEQLGRAAGVAHRQADAARRDHEVDAVASWHGSTRRHDALEVEGLVPEGRPLGDRLVGGQVEVERRAEALRQQEHQRPRPGRGRPPRSGRCDDGPWWRAGGRRAGRRADRRAGSAVGRCRGCGGHRAASERGHGGGPSPDGPLDVPGQPAAAPDQLDGVEGEHCEDERRSRRRRSASGHPDPVARDGRRSVRARSAPRRRTAVPSACRSARARSSSLAASQSSRTPMR